MFDAAVTAGGRLSASDAAHFRTDVKALVRVNGRSLLEIVISALRGVRDIARIIVVGPQTARAFVETDEFIDEFATGEQNLLAALRATRTARIVMSASDLPFVTSSSYADLIARTDAQLDVGYPVFKREEFLEAFPGVRTRFARLADGEWTGGSAFVLNREAVLRNTRMIERGFAARKSLTALAALLGPALLLKFAFGRVGVTDVETRVSSLLGARVRAITGADPALGMDCDGSDEFAYARAEGAG